jgi:hypothetical protein
MQLIRTFYRNGDQLSVYRTATMFIAEYCGNNSGKYLLVDGLNTYAEALRELIKAKVN